MKINNDFHGNKRKVYRLTVVEFDDDGSVDSLIAFCTFAHNDFTRVFFFRKRKSTCFKSLNSNSRLKVAFVELGSLWDLSGNIFDVLQSFIVILYGEKNVHVNETRHTIFSRKF